MSLSDIINAMGHKPRLVELGKIKIGGLGEARTAKGGGSYRMPVKFDHFRVTTMNRDEDGDLVMDAELMRALHAEHGDSDGQLRQIPISLLSNDPDDIMLTRWVWYNGKRCAASSDGKTLTVHYDRKTSKWLDEPNTLEWNQEWADAKDAKNNPLFKLHSTLHCAIRSTCARWGGVYKFRTTSRISFDGLFSTLMHISSLTGGVLIGMPLFLVLRPVRVNPDGKASTVYVCHIELRGPDLLKLQQDAVQVMSYRVANREQVAQLETQYRALLTAPGEESQRETSDVVAEFHPDEQPEEEPEKDEAFDELLDT